MANSSGWKKVRNWWVRMATPVIREIRRPLWGAQAADKQLWSVELIGLPVKPTEEQPHPLCRGVDQAAITNIDYFGQFGLLSYEVEWFVEWLGSEGRVAEILDWVFRAHKWFECSSLPLDRRESIGIHSLRTAHPTAVKDLARLLSQVVDLNNASSEEIRSILLRQVPGVTFPLARSNKDMEQLIAVARNINLLCAERGTLPCQCSALRGLKLP